MDVWSSVWAAVNCNVCEKAGLFGHLLYDATVCVDNNNNNNNTFNLDSEAPSEERFI